MSSGPGGRGGAAQLPAGPTGSQQGWPGNGQDQRDRPEKPCGDEVGGLSSGLRSAALARIELARWSGHATRPSLQPLSPASVSGAQRRRKVREAESRPTTRTGVRARRRAVARTGVPEVPAENHGSQTGCMCVTPVFWPWGNEGSLWPERWWQW